jgi:hypothetical protein
VQQVEFRTSRRAPVGNSSSALPQFDLHPSEAVDPDRTLERLPALSSAGVPAALAPVTEPPPDMASTVELVPEISAADIIESEVVAVRPSTLPLDLDRLLARARAETRSQDFFRPATLSPAAPPALEPAFLFDEPTPPPTTMTSAADQVLPPEARRRGAVLWACAAAVAAMSAVFVIAVVSWPGSSAARDVRPAQAVISAAAAAPVVATRAPDAPFTATPPAVPAVAVQNLPRVAAGTISLAAVAASHRLFVDGKIAPTGSTVVSCGSHVVQVGSRGARRRVDVPCGQEVVVAN